MKKTKFRFEIFEKTTSGVLVQATLKRFLTKEDALKYMQNCYMTKEQFFIVRRNERTGEIKQIKL